MIAALVGHPTHVLSMASSGDHLTRLTLAFDEEIRRMGVTQTTGQPHLQTAVVMENFGSAELQWKAATAIGPPGVLSGHRKTVEGVARAPCTLRHSSIPGFVPCCTT